MVIVALVGALTLLIGHEYLASRGRAGWWTGLRRALLLLLLGAIALTGDLTSARTRLQAVFERDVPPPPLAFDRAGDPLLANALAAQAPARPFPHDGTGEEMRQWRASVVEDVRRMAEYQVDPGTPNVEQLGDEVVGGVRRTLVRFTSWDGSRIPAYVHAPVSGGRGAGVLVIPGHGLGIRATAGLVGDYQHAAAHALARAGYITLTPEVRGFGTLAVGAAPMHRAVASAALETGTFYKAVVARDLGVALSVLAQWPGVDPSRLGVAGASLGGELAVFLGVLDNRVRVIVSQSYGGSIGPTSTEAQVSDEAGQTPHGCHTIPGINRLLWQEDWFRLLAPRPVLVSRGRRNTPRESSAFADAVRGAYDGEGARDRFVFAVEEGGHEFFVVAAQRFLDAWL